MRFLIDENIFPRITSYIHNLGHNVKSIHEEGLFRITDDEIIQMAKNEDRTIITFDKHFGNILKYPSIRYRWNNPYQNTSATSE